LLIDSRAYRQHRWVVEGPVPTFGSASDVKPWLERQPRDVAILFAVRAALRAVPGLFFIPNLDREMRSQNAGRNMLLQAFRSAAAGWAAVAYPSQRGRLNAPVTGSVRNEAQRAVENGLAAIFAEIDKTAAKHANVAVATALSAASAISVQAFDAALSALSADAALFEGGISQRAMAFSSLWPDETPEHVASVWKRLKDKLLSLDEDWEIWLDWYEDRLEGREPSFVFLAALRTMPEGPWPETPKAINQRIRRLLLDDVAETQKFGLGEELEQSFDVEKLAIIGARAALRTLPLLSEMGFAPSAVLGFLRVASLSWMAIAYPSRAKNLVVLNAARNQMKLNSIGIAHAFASATASYSGGAADEIRREVLRGLDDFRATHARAGGRNPEEEFRIALDRDVDRLRATKSSALAIARSELWPAPSDGSWVYRRWRQLRGELIHTGQGWEVWVQWYEDRLIGKVRSEEVELAYPPKVSRENVGHRHFGLPEGSA